MKNENVLKILLESIINSYSLTLFTSKKWIGFIVFLSTFVYIEIGICGLLCLTFAILFAYTLNYDTYSIRSGTLTFNALLVGLGIGFFFHISGFSILLLVIGGVFAVIITIFLKNVLGYYLNLPFLSLPFVIVVIILYIGGYYYGGEQIGQHWTLLDYDLELPLILDTYFKCLGAIFFQLNVYSGILLTVALIIYSRITFFLAILGFFVGISCYGLLTDNLTLAVSNLVGFNFIITAIALGGIFLIPNMSSYCTAILGVLFTCFLGKALEMFFSPYDMPVLAIPFNITALLFIYALKFRSQDREPFLVNFISGSPEENLNYFNYRLTRFGKAKYYRFYLPFNGEWSVTQGIEGEYTHKGIHKYAWDFEVLDEHNKKFRNDGTKLDDYYSFNLPVYASADGLVQKIEDEIEDNHIPGQINIKDNWGNYIILQHNLYCFSTVAHLRKGTVKVTEGQFIKKGTLLGYCGNSGRSPYPHIHFQVQTGKQLDSPTLQVEFINLIHKKENNEKNYVPVYSPKENDKLVNMPHNLNVFNFFNFPIGKEYSFRCSYNNKEFEETWKVDSDYSGLLSIYSIEKHSRAYFYCYDDSFEFYDYHGTKDCALFAFYVSACRVPFTSDMNVSWEDILPCQYFLNKTEKIFKDMILPFFSTPCVKSKYTFIKKNQAGLTHFSTHSTLGINSEVNIYKSNNVKIKKRHWNAECHFELGLGPTIIILNGNNYNFTAIQNQNQSNKA